MHSYGLRFYRCHIDGRIECQCDAKGYCPVLGIHTTEQLRLFCQRNHESAVAIAKAIKSKPKCPPQASVEFEKRLELTRGLWAELHAYKCTDVSDGRKWLADWLKRVPKYCCGQSFHLTMRAHPPDFTSPEAFYEWGVAVHNSVNVKLGKPKWTPTQQIAS